jgi:glycosyltransferase involved in cell wall biosynthesis
VLRVIARMNMGGPAYHVSLLSGRLDRDRYETLLVTGHVGDGEASLAGLADRYGVRRRVIDHLGPELRPAADVLAMRELAAIVRAYRPDIVHTHTAKAGFLGRLAALSVRPRPIIVHTFHGHVLEHYFGRAKSEAYRRIEAALARASDRLIGVSASTVADLERLRVAPSEKLRTIPLGLELEPFLRLPHEPSSPFREEAGAEDHDVLLSFVGRLVPIKRVELLVEAVAVARAQGAPVRLAVVGDGPARPAAERAADEAGVSHAVLFAGYRSDPVTIAAATDIGVLASDNEGTPVSLIEAAAAGRPLVATNVGGVADVVVKDAGFTAPAGDARGLADGILRLARNSELRRQMGRRAREHVRTRFDADRLLRDIDALYAELLAERSR